MKKLFLELPVLFYSGEEDSENREESVKDFSGLSPMNIFVNVHNILTIEDDPLHGDEFCILRFYVDAFIIPLSKEQLLDKIERFLNAPNS